MPNVFGPAPLTPGVSLLRTRMDSSNIRDLIECELRSGKPFSTFHGITPDTIYSFLIEPFAIRTHPYLSEMPQRDMWIVLREHRPPSTVGFVIVYDLVTKAWGIAELTANGEYAVLLSAPSLVAILNCL